MLPINELDHNFPQKNLIAKSFEKNQSVLVAIMLTYCTHNKKFLFVSIPKLEDIARSSKKQYFYLKLLEY